MAVLELTLVRQPGEHDHYHCKPGRTFTIGRGSDCDIRVLDFHMSRHHADLTYKAGLWHITLCSQTGEITLNNRSISDATLSVGDHLILGDSHFTVANLYQVQQDPEPQ